MCMIDAGETYKVSRSAIRTARTQHKCGECSRVIAKGETYRYCTGLYDDYWNVHKTCRHCDVARAWLSKNCGGWLYESVYDDIREHASEYPALAFGINRIVVGMRRGWQRRDGQGLMPVPGMPRSIASVM